VPPNLQRYLPIMLLVLLLLFVVPSLLHRRTTGTSAKTLAGQTIDAFNLIDRAEQAYRLVHRRFTGHLADLLPTHGRLATDLAGGVGVSLDVSTDGQTYLEQVADAYLSLVRSRTGGKVIASSCLVVKSASGVACPTG
jgi:hypothetical protein